MYSNLSISNPVLRTTDNEGVGRIQCTLHFHTLVAMSSVACELRTIQVFQQVDLAVLVSLKGIFKKKTCLTSWRSWNPIRYIELVAASTFGCIVKVYLEQWHLVCFIPFIFTDPQFSQREWCFFHLGKCAAKAQGWRPRGIHRHWKPRCSRLAVEADPLPADPDAHRTSSRLHPHCQWWSPWETENGERLD